MSFQRIAHWLEYIAIRTTICVVQGTRMEACVWWANALAWFAYHVIRLRRRVVDENLAHAFPEWSEHRRREVALKMWRHLFVMVCEIAHAPRKIHDTTWRDHFRIHGERDMISALLSRRPTILVSGHFGNFEMAGFATGLLGVPTYAIARPLDNPYLHKFIARFRSSTGQYVLPKHGSAPQIQALLESGGAFALLADQHAGAKGCWVQFFGRPASCHKAVALFSLSNAAPLLVCYARRGEGPMHFDSGVAEIFDPSCPDDARLQGVMPLSQWYSSVLEREIRRAPEQYWWLHRRWREPPPPRRKQKEKAAA